VGLRKKKVSPKAEIIHTNIQHFAYMLSTRLQMNSLLAQHNTTSVGNIHAEMKQPDNSYAQKGERYRDHINFGYIMEKVGGMII
jgi:hypothetical protein